MDGFDYNNAFSRNIGWVTPKEQLILKSKTVAIAGMGGVGGFHLLTLCRLGVANFHIADPDQFELANFNRQVGAVMSSLNLPKNQTLLAMAKDINPQVNIKVFNAINSDNVTEFLSDCDLYVDGMDFFAVDVRELLFTSCGRLHIPAITAAPMGMGVNYLVFDDNGMSFNDYFQWDNKTEQQKLVHFVIGLAPRALHIKYLVDQSAVDFENKKAPSTVMSCMLCAGVAGVQALKILLNREGVYSAPHYYAFDPYLGKYKKGYLLWGNKNPIQRLKSLVVSRMLARKQSKAAISPMHNLTLIEKIIDLARWAPSGDNSQPWRFKLISEDKFLIIIENHFKKDIYDFDGKPSLVSAGCLIESTQLAANKFGHAISWRIVEQQEVLHIEIELKKSIINEDSLQLVDFLEHRTVDRSYYQKTIPSLQLFDRMGAELDDGFIIHTVTEKEKMKQIIKMNMLGTQVRLVLKETHLVHQHVIQWDKTQTDFGIPYTATGLSKPTTALMKLMFNHWSLMYFFNHHLGGSVLASVEMDYLPGAHSAGFFVINASKSIDSMSPSELIHAGMQIQRAWLYLTKFNVVIQPCYIPIMLSYNVRHKIQLSDNKSINKKINRLSVAYNSLGFSDKTIFIARFGYAKKIKTEIRSTRLPLDQLILRNNN